MKRLTAGVLTVLITTGFAGVVNAAPPTGGIAAKSYVDTQDQALANSVAAKADTTYVDTGLAAKANTTDVNTALATKEDVANKSDDIATDTGSTSKYTTVHAVETYVAPVASDVADLQTSLAAKADTTYVDTGLAAKADQATTYTKTEVDTGLAAKADISSLGNLATADTVGTEDIDDAAVTKPKLSVDVQATLDKANSALQNADLASYAQTTYVDAQDATKADITYVDSGLALKADTASLGSLATAAPGACSDPTNKCVLTFDGTTYSWEIIQR